MKKIKNLVLSLLSIVLLTSVTIQPVIANEETVFKINDVQVNGGSNQTEIIHDEQVETFVNNNEGTFSIRFKVDANKSGLTSILSASDNTKANNYFVLYYNTGGEVGIEFRDTNGSHIINKKENSARLSGDSKWHTVTVTYTQKSYQVYGDGILLFEGGAEFARLKDFSFNTLRIGNLSRTAGDKMWPFEAYVENAFIVDRAYSKDEVLQLQASTAYELPEPLGERTDVFVSGEGGAENYRIPSMIVTKAGTVLTAIDKRYQHWSDWGNIDIAIKRSEDHGVTFSDATTVLDLPDNPNTQGGANSAFYIDATMVQDDESGRIHMLVDMFPESTGFGSVGHDVALFGQPYVETPTGKHLKLRHEDGTFYYVNGEGNVFTLNHEPTNMTVVMESKNAPYQELGDLFVDGKRVSNIYHKYTGTKVRAMATAYLWKTHSDDDGKTWSTPEDITPQVKKDWMHFIGTGPGNGIQLQNGRLLFPIYHTSKHGGNSQSASAIYSDDNGATWQISESVNDGRVVDGQTIYAETLNNGYYITTESQAVQLNNGTILMFMRNGSPKVQYAVSNDNGHSWEPVIKSLESVKEEYVQLSVAHTIQDGKEYILLSNADGVGRNNGSVKVLEVGADNALTHLHSTSVQKGSFLYNVIAELADGTFGVYYEHQSTDYPTASQPSNFGILFKKFSFDQLGKQSEAKYEAVLKDNKLSITSDIPIVQNETVQLRYNLNKTVRGQLTDANTLVFTFEEAVNTIEGFTNGFVEGALGDNINVYNEAHVAKLIAQKEESIHLLPEDLQAKFAEIKADFEAHNKDLLQLADIVDALNSIVITDEHTEIAYENFTVKATSEAPIENESQKYGPIEYAFDKDESTFWHTVNGQHDPSYTVTFDFEEMARIDKLRLLPRQDNSNNSMIEKYEVYATVDEKRIKVAEGEWPVNKDWKEVVFDVPVLTDKLELVSVKSWGRTAGAAEITLHGAIIGTPANTTELEAKLLEVSDLDLSLYTEETVAVLLALVEEAELIIANPNVEQAVVDKLVIDITQAIEQLEEIIVIDTSELEAKLLEVNELDLSLYTEETVAALLALVEEAELIIANPNVEQAVVDKLVTEITQAIKQLEEIIVIDKSELEVLIDEVVAKDLSEYTEESVAALNKALANAKLTLENLDATQAEIDEAVSNLQAAVDGLKEDTSIPLTPLEPSKPKDEKPTVPSKPEGDKPPTGIANNYLAYLVIIGAALVVLRKTKAKQ